ncbi:speckle-type POZ protein B-like isoform X2 [Schistocerca nitens]|uniref:speckle-type POZ protein B-like isoform X2 n=1 Tax=Schistocerca nitens TaxID=7011 RepID=UPI002119141A|nr:speckle-type POZ protein B-like isoform X2 [Schistocerca nitens]
MSSPETEQRGATVYLGSLLDADQGMVELVSGNTRLVAHRAVVAARSPVLASMLDNGSDQLTIPDVEGPVLAMLVSYMYAFRLSGLGGMGPQLLAAADQYKVVGLRAACEQLMAAENTAD